MDALGFATSGNGKAVSFNNGTQKNINTIAARAAPALRGVIGQGNDASYTKFQQGKNPSIYTDVPSLNQALKGGQINKQQWQNQFRVIQNKTNAPPIKGGLAGAIGSFGTAVNKVGLGLPMAGVSGVRSASDIVRGAAASGDYPGGKLNPTALANAQQAKQRDFPAFVSPFTRPLVQAAESVVHPFSQHSFTPQGKNQQEILGNTPIQNINKGVASTYTAHKGLNPIVRVALAGGYGLSQAAQDVGVSSIVKSGGLIGGLKAAQARLGPKEVPSTLPTKSLTSYEGAPDAAKVAQYKAQLQAGKPIEPLIVKKDSLGNLGVEDGKHRLEAARQLGIKDVPVTMGADVAKGPDLIAHDVPAYTKQVQNTLDNTKAVTRAGDLHGAAKEFQSLFTPGTGANAKLVKNDFRAATGNMALDQSVQSHSLQGATKFFDKQTPGNNLNFIQRFESGLKQPNPTLDAHAGVFKDWFQKDLGLARQIKPDTPELENYFAHSGIWDNPTAAKSFYNKFAQPTLGGKPGALEARQFPTIYDGIKAGLKPKETNPAVLAINNRAQLLRAKMAQDFTEEQAAKGADPELVQKIVDRYLQPGLNRSAAFRTVKQAAYGLNNVQLGFSGFHIAGTGINAAVSQFANGLQDVLRGKVPTGVAKIATSPTAPIRYIFNGSKMLRDVRSGHLTQDLKNVAEGGGRVDRQVTYQTTGLSKSINDIRHGDLQAKVGGAAMLPFRAIGSSAKPVMEWWVPRIKAGATKDLIDRKVAELGPNASQSALRAAKAEAVDSIDNRFGQLVQDNLFWNKPLKDMMSVMMRSPGWNIGTMREIGGGATNLVRPSVLKGLASGKGIPESTAYTLSLASTTMMIGTAMNYMFTGKPPSSLIDYFYPKTGKTDKNGNDERVALPTYAKDVFAFSHNPVQTVKNKANPIISVGLNLAQNKDYFGNQVRNPNDSLASQGKQLLGYASKNVLPFTLTNANQRVDKGEGTKAQSFFGVTPAPGYITKSPFQQKVEAALNQALGQKTLTPEQVALNNAKTQARTAAGKGDNSLIQALVNSQQITNKQGQNLKAKAGQTSLQRAFDYLASQDKKTAAQLYKQATPADKAKLGKVNVNKLYAK